MNYEEKLKAEKDKLSEELEGLSHLFYSNISSIIINFYFYFPKIKFFFFFIEA